MRISLPHLGGNLDVALPTNLSRAKIKQAIFWKRFSHGLWENNNLRLLKSIVKQEDVFFDIGAWIGPVTLYVGYILSIQGKCYSFEPDSTAYGILENNLRMNPQIKGQMQCIPYGIWDKTGVQQLLVGPNKLNWLVGDNGYGDSTSFVGKDATDNGVAINTVTLQDFLSKEGVKTIDFLKLDIEGGESKIMSSILQSLKDANIRHTKFLIEVHPYGFTPEEKEVFVDLLFANCRTILLIDSREGTRLSHEDLRKFITSKNKPFQIYACLK